MLSRHFGTDHEGPACSGVHGSPAAIVGQCVQALLAHHPYHLSAFPTWVAEAVLGKDYAPAMEALAKKRRMWRTTALYKSPIAVAYSGAPCAFYTAYACFADALTRSGGSLSLPALVSTIRDLISVHKLHVVRLLDIYLLVLSSVCVESGGTAPPIGMAVFEAVGFSFPCALRSAFSLFTSRMHATGATQNAAKWTLQTFNNSQCVSLLAALVQQQAMKLEEAYGIFVEMFSEASHNNSAYVAVMKYAEDVCAWAKGCTTETVANVNPPARGLVASSGSHSTAAAQRVINANELFAMKFSVLKPPPPSGLQRENYLTFGHFASALLQVGAWQPALQCLMAAETSGLPGPVSALLLLERGCFGRFFSSPVESLVAAFHRWVSSVKALPQEVFNREAQQLLEQYDAMLEVVSYAQATLCDPLFLDVAMAFLLARSQGSSCDGVVVQWKQRAAQFLCDVVFPCLRVLAPSPSLAQHISELLTVMPDDAKLAIFSSIGAVQVPC